MHKSLQPYLDRVDQGLIRMVEKGSRVLFNYTDKCVFEKAWDEYTMKARGIIFYKNSGKCIARPFDKFFNYSEFLGLFGQDALDKLLTQPHYIQEKLDGSLGIIYKPSSNYYSGKWSIATRGSFTSDQAIRGTEILKKYDLSEVHPRSTLLVEIIYPENKIIVPYEQEELVLLAARTRKLGRYYSRDDLKDLGKHLGMRVANPASLTIDGCLEAQKTIPYQQEGWVVVFDDGTRLKIKGDDYMRIAKFKANLSPLAVWEAMVARKFSEMHVACPEEIREELEAIENRIDEDTAKLIYAIIAVDHEINWALDRKEIALQIATKPEWMHGALFGHLSQKRSYWESAIKLLRPKNNEFADIWGYL